MILVVEKFLDVGGLAEWETYVMVSAWSDYIPVLLKATETALYPKQWVYPLSQFVLEGTNELFTRKIFFFLN